MTEQELYTLRFPIGEFTKPDIITPQQIESWIQDIELFPARVKELTENITADQKNWKYRPGGWTFKQVVHHCADSHINSITRFKLTLTEDNPTIRPYMEDRWANLIDSQDDNLENSLLLLTGLHAKLGQLLRNISEEDLKRTFIHPEHGKSIALDENIGSYAWHSNHHLAHLKNALASEGQY